MHKGLQLLSDREAYDNGWTIGELETFVLSRYDEDWIRCDPSETVQVIARTQDNYSHILLQWYLKKRLVQHQKQRLHNPEIDEAVKIAIHNYFFGDSMSFTSNRQARIASELDTRRKVKLSGLEALLSLELMDEPISTVVGFICDSLVNKFIHDFQKSDLITALVSAIKRTTFTIDNKQTFQDQVDTYSKADEYTEEWELVLKALVTRVDELSNATSSDQSSDKVPTNQIHQDLKLLGKTKKYNIFFVNHDQILLVTNDPMQEKHLLTIKNGVIVNSTSDELAELAGGLKWVASFTSVMWGFLKAAQ